MEVLNMDIEKITDEDMCNHLAQLEYVINNSKSQKVIDDARETEKIIKLAQAQRKAGLN